MIRSLGSPEHSTRPLAELRRSFWSAFRLAQVRLRFLLILLAIFFVVGKWDLLCNYWDRWTARPVDLTAAVSGDTEYWCPMCPGIISDWPGKCPVCNMDLVRRAKHEAPPLPSGVMARMQLSPYRIQLAGVQTSEVRYQSLVREIVTSGRVAYDDTDAARSNTTHLCATGEVFESDVPFLTRGQAAEVIWDAFPGHSTFPGQVRSVSFHGENGVTRWQLRVAFDAPQAELPVGSLVRIRVGVSATARPWSARTLADTWCQSNTAELAGVAILNPTGLGGGAGLATLLNAAGAQALQARQQVLAIPESAVIDTGAERIVYVDRGQGMFDAVAVKLGPRCGDNFPVLHGLAAGQRVVSRGAFLLDAESHLSPAAASMYFGASSTQPAAEPPHETHHHHTNPDVGPLAGLSAADRAQVAAQVYCPVNPANRLGSMGPPCKIQLGGQVVFLCCSGCLHEALAHPKQIRDRLADWKRRPPSSASVK